MENISTLYEKVLYTAPYNFLINYNIIEFDLEKANISALYEEKFISQEQYLYYYNLSKQEREIQIGKLIKSNSDIYSIIQKGIIHAKQMFFTANKIYTDIILYINNDSVTLIYPIQYQKKFITHFSSVYNFKIKNVYTSFVKLYGIDLLYFNNGNIELYRLKNCNQAFLESRHKNGFLDLLLTIMYNGQFDKLENTIHLISDIYIQYVNKTFPVNYYREFNSSSNYKIISGSNVMTYYIENDIEQSLLKDVNISYNSAVLQLLYQYFIKQYFIKNK